MEGNSDSEFRRKKAKDSNSQTFPDTDDTDLTDDFDPDLTDFDHPPSQVSKSSQVSSLPQLHKVGIQWNVV